MFYGDVSCGIGGARRKERSDGSADCPISQSGSYQLMTNAACQPQGESYLPDCQPSGEVIARLKDVS